MNKERIKVIIPYFIILVASLGTLLPQIAFHATILGSDTVFHWSRFYDIKMQLANGSFNWFQMNYTFQQTGQIVNAFYGPLFAWLNGVLLFITNNWFQYQIVSGLILLLISGIGIYRMCLKVNCPSYLGVILAILYNNVGMIPVWLIGSNFSAWGAALMPYLCIQIVNLLEEKKNPYHWQVVTLIFAIVANIHLLSFILLALAFCPFLFLSFIRTTNKGLFILGLVKSALWGIGLTGTIWGCFLLVYRTNKISSPVTFDLAGATIHLSPKGVALKDFLIAVAILFLLQILLAIITFKLNINNFYITFVGTLFLLLATNWLINWSTVQKIFPGLGSSFQFPFRFTIVFYALFMLGLAYSSQLLFKNTKYGKWIYTISIALVTIFAYQETFSWVQRTSSQTNSVMIYSPKSKVFNEQQVEAFGNKPGQLFRYYLNIKPDYLPVTNKKLNPNDVRDLYEKFIKDDYIKYQRRVLKNGSLELKWNSSKKEKITLPLIMYQQSELIVNGKRLTHLQKTEIGNPVVQSKIGVNNAILSFRVPLWFNLLIVVNFASWILFIATFCFKRK